MLSSPIILCDDLLRHVLGGVWFLDSRKPEVTDLENTVAVHEQIAGLDVTVQDSRWVEVF